MSVIERKYEKRMLMIQNDDDDDLNIILMTIMMMMTMSDNGDLDADHDEKYIHRSTCDRRKQLPSVPQYSNTCPAL